MSKIIISKSHLLGTKAFGNRAMRDIKRYDKKNVLNSYAERKELFNKLREKRDGGVTRKELREVMAEFKYDPHNSLSAKEINTLAKELGMKPITKKYLPRVKKTEDTHEQLHAARNKVEFRESGPHKAKTDKELAAEKDDDEQDAKDLPYKSAQQSYMEAQYSSHT